MDLLGTTTIFLVVCLVLLVAWRKVEARRKNWPPGPTPLPIIGNLLQLKGFNISKHLKELSATYGPIFTVFFGSDQMVVVYGSDLVKKVLVEKGDEFLNRGSLPSAEKASRGLGVLMSNGERWVQIRRFSLMTLRNFGMGKKSIEERIQEEAQHLVKALRETKGQPLSSSSIFNCATGNVISYILLGDRFDYQDKEYLRIIKILTYGFKMESSLVGQLYNMFHWIIDYFPGPHLRILEEAFSIQGFINQKIEEHVKTFDATDVPRDFIEAFLLKMEQGATVLPMLTSLLNDSKQFKDPHRFDPEHFLDEKGNFKKNGADVPFSAGKRNCLGEGLARMELFLFVTTILQNFRLKYPPGVTKIDLTPDVSGFLNIPRQVPFCFSPR